MNGSLFLDWTKVVTVSGTRWQWNLQLFWPCKQRLGLAEASKGFFPQRRCRKRKWNFIVCGIKIWWQGRGSWPVQSCRPSEIQVYRGGASRVPTQSAHLLWLVLCHINELCYNRDLLGLLHFSTIPPQDQASMYSRVCSWVGGIPFRVPLGVQSMQFDIPQVKMGTAWHTWSTFCSHQKPLLMPHPSDQTAV